MYVVLDPGANPTVVGYTTTKSFLPKNLAFSAEKRLEVLKRDSIEKHIFIGIHLVDFY
jgi:hypothetical protein